jgi:uncharacterized Zn finger protein (UPF0148 family)
MSELICTKCGAPLKNNSFYCSKCGTRVGLATKIEVSEKTLAKRAKDEAKIAEQKAKKQERNAKREAKREENRIKRQTPAYKKMQKIVGTTVPCSVIVVTLLLVFLLVPIQASAMGYGIALDPSESGGIEIYDYNNKTEDPEIPEEIWYLGAMYPVTSISDYAFHGANITSIVIPDSVIHIGTGAFTGSYPLRYVKMGNGVTDIGTSAFADCRSLTNIVLPDSLTYIGGNAFAYTGLKSIVIPDGVTTIGYYAFEYCESLTSIVIPKSVTSLGSDIFSGCYNLRDIYYTGTQEQWYNLSIAYENAVLNANIHFNYVPDAE